MKVLFAVSNEEMSKTIIKKYQTEYKQIISFKNVYYFNAILKELQRDKSYDRVIISEDLEQYVNTDYEQMDKFLFDRLDSISDEASNMNGEDIPIILICTERRNKSEQILVKLFGIGIYNALLGNDRSATEICRLINRPRSKKEAKIYYKIDAEDVSYEKDDENDVSELEIQNILSHYKRIGNDEERYVESFESIASQYNETQLRVISKCLPLNVRAVLEEKSPQYQKINSYTNKISDKVRMENKTEKPGTSEILLKNSRIKQPSGPVIIPSAIDTSKRKKILTKATSTTIENPKKVMQEHTEKQEDILKDIQIEEIPEIKEIPQEEYMPQVDINTIEENNQEEIIQPIKRGRGRPKKVVAEPVIEQTKRKRGRPRKVVEQENVNELKEIEEEILPGFEDFEEESVVSLDTNAEETVLPGFEESDNDNRIEEEILPGFDDINDDESILPGFDDINEEESVLPGFNDAEDEKMELSGFDNLNNEENVLPGFEENKIDEQYTNVLNNLRLENQKEKIEEEFIKKESVEYPELDLSRIMQGNQKIAAFVGTSKNGTSFLVNNVAEILSMNGIDTAILDLTKNRNSYYIYTKNEENLRNQSNYIMNNLKIGKANGIQEHKNLTIYTSSLENDENIEAVEPILETLIKTHTVVLMDCDFTTPMRYFKYAQEIYLVQSMDILTIQPLTAFLRQLKDKGMFEESKARVILNKFKRTKQINEEILIGGISIYNDAAMTIRKELFNRKTIQHITIPFDETSYFRYLDGLVICDVSLKGYTKEFMQSLKSLANMVYQGTNKTSGKYMPPSVKNNSSAFSPRVNNTLNQMKRNY